MFLVNRRQGPGACPGSLASMMRVRSSNSAGQTEHVLGNRSRGAVSALHCRLCDIATRIIPDYVTLIRPYPGALLQIQNGVLALVGSAGTALLLFVLLMIAYSRQLMGGGDVKMMTAFAFEFTPIWYLLVCYLTVLAGGLLGIAYLLLSRTSISWHADNRASPIARVLAVEAWRVRKRAPLPYGVAIAIGGAITLLIRRPTPLCLILCSILLLTAPGLGLVGYQITRPPKTVTVTVAPEAPPPPLTVDVLVAARALPAGTLMKEEDFTKRAVLSAEVPKGA